MSTPGSVLVIGSGVIGLCTAYALRERGYRVTVVERGGADRDCCSLGNAGMVTPSHFVPLAAPGMVAMGLRMLLNPEGPFAIRAQADPALLRWAWQFYRAGTPEHVRRAGPVLRDLLFASQAAFDGLAGRLGDFGLRKRGLLMLCRRPDTLHHEEALAKLARSLNVEAELVTPAEALRLEPALQMDIAGGVYFPQDWHLDPRRFMAALTDHLRESGVEFLWNTEVTGFRTRGKQVEAAVTPSGELAADEFVLAGGSWTARLARELGLRLPLQAGKGYNLTLPSPPGLPAMGSILVEARVAVTPMGDSLRFAGTMELGGLDLSINRRRVDGMVRSIAAYYPEVKPELFRELPVWSGLRPCSPDGLPYIGRPARCSNVTIAAGHAMLGLSLGPVTGQLVANILTGEPPPVDLQPLSPDRYA